MLNCYRENHTKFCWIIIIGSFCSFILSMILATAVFNKSSAITSNSDPEIEMFTLMDLYNHHVDVWTDSILPLHITVDLGNFSKLDVDCKNPRPGSLTDMIPISGPVCGSGSTTMKIAVVDRSEIPSSDEMSHDVVPMAYIREESMAQVRPMIKFAAVTIKKLRFIGWLMFFFGIYLFVTGARRVYVQVRKV